MNHQSKIIWISASPSLKQLHLRLLNSLSKTVEIEFWEYHQSLDEGSSIDVAVKLLHKYLANIIRPVHLIGHGIGGEIALSYARLYPAKISSLTLLSVAVQPAINWHSYYYSQLRSFPSSRECILRSIAVNLFPYGCTSHIHGLVERLERDLVEAPSSHSLFQLNIASECGVDVPLLICGSQDDPVITKSALLGWENYFKSSDSIWCATSGGHFFHHFNAEVVSTKIHSFWRQLNPESVADRLISMELN
jgi:pimeloyl-ACP methyl ester carboxylesterase